MKFNCEINRDAPLSLFEKAAPLAAILWVVAMCFIFAGCATKTRNVEMDGMFVQADSATVAVGSIDVMASPVGEESAIIKYAEDTAWLSPSTKTHFIRIQLTGTNSTEQAAEIVKSICGAFVPVAAVVNGESVTNVPSASVAGDIVTKAVSAK